MSKTAAILVSDGVEDIEFLVPCDILRRAGIQVDLVSVDNQEIVKGDMGGEFTGLQMMKDYDFSNADALIIPGGSGYENIKKSEQACQLMASFANNPKKVLGAICAGAGLAGQLGLFKGKNYVCVPDMNSDDFGGHFEMKHAVIDGNLVTGISVGGAFQFAFDLVTVLIDKHHADELKKAVCYSL